MKLSIILPAYNEGSHINAVVRQVMDARPSIIEKTDISEVEVVVVNDGSIDETHQNLESMLRGNPDSFIVENHAVNMGYGAALKTGFQAASGEYLSFMDADGTIDPLSFIDLYNGLQKESGDMALGKRFGNKDSKMPFVRKIGNYFFASLLSFLSGEKIQDTASGVRLFRREILDRLYPLPDGLHFTPAMSSKAVHENVKMVEVPIQYDQRSGESKLSVVGDGYRFLRIILGTVLIYNPFKVFFLLGSSFIFLSCLLIAKPLYVWLSPQDMVFSDYIYRSIGSMYFFVCGFLIILFGILARFLVSTFFRLHESGEWIHRLNKTVQIYDRMALYGAFIFFCGVAVNAAYFMRYIIEKSLEFHWGWLLMAAGMIIMGLQMMITGLIMKIVKKIKENIIKE